MTQAGGPRWWQPIADRLGPEALALAISIPVVILFVVIIAVLAIAGR